MNRGPDQVGSQTRGGQNFRGSSIVTVKRTQLTIAIMGGAAILRMADIKWTLLYNQPVALASACRTYSCSVLK